MEIALVVVALILLFLHWKGPNAVWGGATLGLIVGLIIALVRGDWGILALSFSIGTFVGTFFEWVGRISKR
jgi:hypothetical protein